MINTTHSMESPHKRFIRVAILISKDSVRHQNQPFGAILVDKDGNILLTAENTELSGGFMGHAEMNLLLKVIQEKIPLEKLKTCTLYTSTEPCLGCTGWIFKSGIGNVVYACSSLRMSVIIGSGSNKPSFRDLVKLYNKNINVEGPILEEEAVEVISEFRALRGQ